MLVPFAYYEAAANLMMVLNLLRLCSKPLDGWWPASVAGHSKFQPIDHGNPDQI